MLTLTSLTGVIILALMHVIVRWCRFLDSPRTPWHSFAGGVAVSYVFVYTLPKLSKMQAVLFHSADSGPFGFLEHHAYLVALCGFVVYYALDRAAMLQKELHSEQSVGKTLRLYRFVNLLMYGAYLVLIGYYLATVPDFVVLIMAVLAMLLHFLSIAYEIRHGIESIYDSHLRWLMAALLIIGWLLGVLSQVPEKVEALWFAFLAGAILIHAIEAELPAKRHHRLGPFLIGTLSFAAVAVFIRWHLNQS